MKFPSVTYRFAVWFVLVSLLPILLIGFVLLQSFEAEMKKTAEYHVAAIADKKIDDINVYLNERVRDGAVLANEESTQQAMRDLARAYAQGGVKSETYRRLDIKYRRSFEHFAELAGYYDVFLISPQGAVVYTNRHEPDFNTNLFTGPYAKTGLAKIVHRALNTLQGSVSDFDHYAPSGGEIAAFISEPLVVDGKMEGVLALQINNDHVWAVLTDNVGLGSSGETVVTRLDGENLALVMAPLKSEPDAALKRLIPLTVNATRLGLQGQRGSGVVDDYRGVSVVAAWRYLPRMGWGIVVKTDGSEAFAPVYRMRLIGLLVLGLTMIAAILGAFLLGRGVVNPLKKLSLAAGNLDERVAIQGRDEVSQLGMAFNSMAARLSALAIRQRQAQKALAESNESLEHRVEERTATLTDMTGQLRREREFAETLIQSAPVIVLLLSSEGKIQLVNPYFETLTGYKLEEIRGKDWIEGFLPARDHDRIRSLFNKASQGTQTCGNINAILIRSGEERLIEWSDAIISNEDGRKISLLSIGVDITESRALEQIVFDVSRHNRSLLQLIKDIESAETRAEVISALNREVSETLGYSYSWITLAGDGEKITVLGPDSERTNIQSDPFLRELAITGHVVVIDDMQGDPRIDQKINQALEGRTRVHVPLRLSGPLMGALETGTFGSEGVRPPTPEEIDYLVSAAHHVAVVLDRLEFTEALRLREEQLKEAQHMARMGSIERNHVSGEFYFSDEAYHIFELDKEQHGTDIFEASYAVIHPEDRSAADKAYLTSLESREPGQCTYRLLMPDGRIKWVEHRVRHWYDEGGKPLRTTSTVQDITERLELTQALRHSEAVLHEAQRLARIGSWELDLASKTVSWSDEIYQILEQDKVLFPASYERFRAAIHPNDLELVDNIYLAAVVDGTPCSFTHRLIMPDGRIKWVEEHGQTEYDQNGKPLLIVGSVQDVTERVELIQALTLSQEKLKEAQRIAGIGFWDLDLVSGVLDWSDEIYNIFQIDKKKFGASYEAFLSAIHPEDREAVDNAYTSSLANRLPYQITHRLQMPDGQIKWVEERCQSWYDESGKPVRSTGTVQDITERMALTQALTYSEAGLNEAQRMALIGSWELDPVKNHMSLSEGAFNILELDKEKFNGDMGPTMNIIHPEDLQKVTGALEESIANNTPYHLVYRALMPDGRLKWLEGRAKNSYDESGKLYIVGTLQDVTARVANEEKLRRSLAEKETLLREIHHRVKNNLQIISSLLYFQAKKVKAPEDLEVMTDSRDRLRAMILVHETLYQSSDLNRGNFGDYLQTLASQLADAHAARARGIAVRLEAGDYALPIETALPCGMIICELLINAFKYAFPDGRKGEVAVIIKVKNGRVEMSVNDNGVGLPKDFSTETTESFGWQLINSLVVQIGGTISVRRNSGTGVNISFPYIMVKE